jgi:hypothetical protein
MGYKKMTPVFRSHFFIPILLGLVELLGQLRLLAVGGVLVYNALCGGFINGACGGHERSLLVFCAIGGGGLELLYRGLQRRLRHAVAQAVPFADEHPFLSGLDIRQSIHLLACNNCSEWYFIMAILALQAKFINFAAF